MVCLFLTKFFLAVTNSIFHEVKYIWQFLSWQICLEMFIMPRDFQILTLAHIPEISTLRFKHEVHSPTRISY